MHDVVEDTKYEDKDILKEFGEDILSHVMGDSEPDKKLSWEERKQYTIDEVKTFDIRHKAIVCDDKISNLEDLQIVFEKMINMIFQILIEDTKNKSGILLHFMIV